MRSFMILWSVALAGLLGAIVLGLQLPKAVIPSTSVSGDREVVSFSQEDSNDSPPNSTSVITHALPRRVALLFSGHLRNFEELIPHYQQVFSHSDISLDLYFSVWHDDRWTNMRDTLQQSWPEIQQFWHVEVPTGVFEFPKRIKFVPMKSQMYRYKRVFEMVSDPSRYDWMIRIRPDLIFLQAFPYHEMHSADVLTISSQWFPPRPEWVHDFCYAARPHIMDHLCHMVDRFDDWSEKLPKEGAEYKFFCEHITYLELQASKALVKNVSWDLALARMSDDTNSDMRPEIVSLRKQGQFKGLPKNALMNQSYR